MGVPKQVEEAAALAEELFNGITAQTAPEEEPEETSTANQQEPDSETDDEHDVPHDDDVEELRKFKDRYLSLKGKYDAEVPRLHGELKELKQSVFERLGQMAEQKKDEPTEPVLDKMAKLKEEYGDEFIDNIREILKLEVEPLLNNSFKPMQEQVASIEETQVEAARQNFANYVSGKVQGDWQALWNNPSEKFVEFLQQPDPSGLHTYGELISAYSDKWDADKVSIVFNTFFEQNQPKQKAAPKSNPVQDAMVAPSRNTQHTTPDAGEKRVWTKAMISEFERADRQGKYPADESQAMWNDLLSAAAENRIRG